MTTTNHLRLAYGTRHLDYNPAAHLGAWGARLIYREVLEGGRGVVGDRVDGIGHIAQLSGTAQQAEVLAEMQDALDAVLRKVREVGLSPSSDDVVELMHGPCFAAASPQGSYGYLYVTIVFPTGTEPS